jgi:hypothetical protein
MRELIAEKPDDVLNFLEESGLLKVAEFEASDVLALRAFAASDGLLTLGREHFEVEWEAMWRARLAELGTTRAIRGISAGSGLLGNGGGGAGGAGAAAGGGIGWSSTVTLEAHVVNVRDAAAQGARGLLQPLLKRYQAGACSMAVFALPAVQAVIHFKWTSWARRFLLYELAAYVVWLAAFTGFTLAFQGEDWRMGLDETLRSPYGAAATACSALCVLAMLPFLYMDACTLVAYSAGWAASPWNMCARACSVCEVLWCCDVVMSWLCGWVVDECIPQGWPPSQPSPTPQPLFNQRNPPPHQKKPNQPRHGVVRPTAGHLGAAPAARLRRRGLVLGHGRGAARPDVDQVTVLCARVQPHQNHVHRHDPARDRRHEVVPAVPADDARRLCARVLRALPPGPRRVRRLCQRLALVRDHVFVLIGHV